jgi:mannan endo-1,4-beta-mannosidase
MKKMKRIAYLFLLFAFFACNPPEKPTENENQEKTSKKEWLDYFNAIKRKKCISGQFIRWNYNASLQEITAVHDSTGQWLGMLGADYYGNFQDSIPSPRCEYKLANSVIKDYYKDSKHSLVNLSVHFINPQNMGSAWFKEIDFDSVLIEGSRVNKVFMEELDSVAVGLQNLCDAGIMVMFRPFHEMSGGWFWWGDQERFPELWRMTYNYIVNEKGLNNMLWCWGPSAQHTNLDRYYPGDEYVDLVALDAYTPDLPKKAMEAYKTILKYNKPFGWGEYGCQAGPVFYEKIDFDYSIMLKWIKKDFPETTFFLTWRDAKGMVDKKGVRELLNDSAIVNREDLLLK